MPISLIACVIKHRNKLVIGKDNDLLVKLKKDLEFFKNITSNKIQELPNIVLMGRHTYYSIPTNYRPLKGRLNFVLSNDPGYLKKYPLPKHPKDLSTEHTYYLTLLQFQNFYNLFNPNVFVIGGGQVYNLFLNNRDFIISKLYITEVTGVKISDPTNLITMPHFDYRYKLIGYSEKHTQNELSYRFLTYNYLNQGTQEHLYFDLAHNILRNGNERSDRTGTGTISLLGAQLKFDISSSFPLLTTKQVPFKAIVEELLFFCRGDTDCKILDKRGVKIWNDNTTRKFLDNRGLTYSEGIMGPMYGWCWRNFGAKYNEAFADTSKCDTSKIGGFDQLKHVEHLLKTDPFSRRIYISNLNPAESSKMCLEPCHTYIQFYVTEEKNQKYLSAYFSMRSSDYFLAATSFNTPSYILLIQILALKCNMKPKEIIYNAVDCHIYKNHIEQIKEQMTRVPRPFPCVKLDESIKTKDWVDITYDDFDLIGYFPHPTIKAKMAI
jgi:dihydrofolate reductase/thymidylate synthase